MPWPRLKSSLLPQWFSRIVLNPSWEQHPATDFSPFTPDDLKDSLNQALWELCFTVHSTIYLLYNFTWKFCGGVQTAELKLWKSCKIYYHTCICVQLFYSSRSLKSTSETSTCNQSNATKIQHIYYLFLFLCTANNAYSTQRISQCFTNDIYIGIPSTLKCPGLEGGLQPRK